MQAVAEVIVNRTKAKGFPNSVCKVVKQNVQFSYLNKAKGRINLDVSEITSSKNPLIASKARKSIDISNKILDGAYQRLLPYDTLWFHTKQVQPGWSKKFVRVKTIDNHHFYRRK